MQNFFERIKAWYRELPEKKRYIEFITALLSIPVLLTVIIINLNNLNQQKNNTQTQTNNDKVIPIQVVMTGSINPPPAATQSASNPTITPSACISLVGPVSILSPQDGQVITQSPVCITIGFQTNYCPVTWSYSLDYGNWSNFSNNNICLSGLQNGTRTIQLKIRSTVSSDQIILQRSFIYQGNPISPTPTPANASSSANL